MSQFKSHSSSNSFWLQYVQDPWGVCEPDGWQICRILPNLTLFLKIIKFLLFMYPLIKSKLCNRKMLLMRVHILVGDLVRVSLSKYGKKLGSWGRFPSPQVLLCLLYKWVEMHVTCPNETWKSPRILKADFRIWLKCFLIGFIKNVYFSSSQTNFLLLSHNIYIEIHNVVQ